MNLAELQPYEILNLYVIFEILVSVVAVTTWKFYQVFDHLNLNIVQKRGSKDE